MNNRNSEKLSFKKCLVANFSHLQPILPILYHKNYHNFVLEFKTLPGVFSAEDENRTQSPVS